jgi:hypothetical protein
LAVGAASAGALLLCSALLRGGPLRCDAMDEPLRGLEGV